MKFLLKALLLAALVFSCSKPDELEKCSDSEFATFTDYTGLDGCGWLLKLSNGEILEPTNLFSFDINPTEGQEVWVKYHTFDGVSICMVGKIVELECLTSH